MEYSEERQHYLAIYRQQLKREMDAMGYGQPRGYVPNPNAEARENSTSYWVLAAFAVALLGTG